MIREICSGGGARGAFHAGVVKFLDKKGIDIGERYGASIGGVNVLLRSAGYSLHEIWPKYFKFEKIAWKMFLAWIQKKDIYDAINMKHIYASLVASNKTFDMLYTPTFVTATDLDDNTPVIFGDYGEDSVLKAMIATSCYPILFGPVHYKGRYYIDGGVSNNVPIPFNKLKPEDITIVTLLCDSKFDFLPANFSALRGIKRKLAEGMALWDSFINREVAAEIKTWNEEKFGKLFVIAIDKEDAISGFDFSHTEELIQKGYAKASEVLQPLLTEV